MSVSDRFMVPLRALLRLATMAAVLVPHADAASASDDDPYLVESFIVAHQSPDLDVQILEPDYGPDGENILVSYRSSHDWWSLYVLGPDGTARVVIEQATGEVNNGHTPRPAWSPDGTHIAYIATHGQTDAAELFLTSSEGGRRVQLTHLSKLLGRPAWSPDGRRIAIQAADARERTVDLHIVSVEGILEDPAAPTGLAAEASPWVPDGSPQDGQIGYPGAVSWSPDGERIFYGTADGIYAARVDGSGIELLVPGPYTDPALSSDGHTLVVAGTIGPAAPSRFGFAFPPPMSALYLVDLNDEDVEPRMVVSPYWFAGIGPTNPRWSPDGERLLFAGSYGFIGRVYSVSVEEALRHVPDQILEGSYFVRSQQDLADLLDPEANSITLVGDLRIIGSDLSDLTGLKGLRSVAGGLIIEDNAALASLHGLDSLRLSTGLPGYRLKERETSLVIRGNPVLGDVSALDGLRHARRILIAENDSLADLTLTSLTRTGVLRVEQNPRLKQIVAPQLRHAYLFITHNEHLESIEFPLVESGNVRLWGLPQLREIRGLSLLKKATWLVISHTSRLRSLPSFDHLEWVSEQLDISDNDSLETLDGLSDLVTLSGAPTDDVERYPYTSFDYPVFSTPHLRISRNPQLRSIEALLDIDVWSVNDEYFAEIVSNPLLPATQVQQLIDTMSRAYQYVFATVRENGPETPTDPPDADQGPITLSNFSYPNPTRSAATVSVDLSGGGATVHGAVYNVAGQRVATLQDGPLSRGLHALRWDCTDGAGRRVAAGVYLLRVTGAEPTPRTYRIIVLP